MGATESKSQRRPRNFQNSIEEPLEDITPMTAASEPRPGTSQQEESSAGGDSNGTSSIDERRTRRKKIKKKGNKKMVLIKCDPDLRCADVDDILLAKDYSNQFEYRMLQFAIHFVAQFEKNKYRHYMLHDINLRILGDKTTWNFRSGTAMHEFVVLGTGREELKLLDKRLGGSLYVQDGGYAVWSFKPPVQMKRMQKRRP